MPGAVAVCACVRGGGGAHGEGVLGDECWVEGPEHRVEDEGRLAVGAVGTHLDQKQAVSNLQPYGAHHLPEALLASILLGGALHEPLERGHERGEVLGGREVVARGDALEEGLGRACEGAGWVHGAAGWMTRGVVGWVHGVAASSARGCSLQRMGLQRGACLGGELLLEHGEGVPQWLVHVLDELGAAPRPVRHHLQDLVHEVRAGVCGAEWLAHAAHGQDHPPHLVRGQDQWSGSGSVVRVRVRVWVMLIRRTLVTICAGGSSSRRLHTLLQDLARREALAQRLARRLALGVHARVDELACIAWGCSMGTWRSSLGTWGCSLGCMMFQTERGTVAEKRQGVVQGGTGWCGVVRGAWTGAPKWSSISVTRTKTAGAGEVQAGAERVWSAAQRGGASPAASSLLSVVAPVWRS
eukprot:scaffold24358_cov60-Phaeocystis_antarctica.AAC.5